MMVKTRHSAGPTTAQTIFRWGQILLAILLILAGLGMLGGMAAAFADQGTLPVEDTALLLGAIIMTASGGYWLVRLKPFRALQEPVSNRIRRSRVCDCPRIFIRRGRESRYLRKWAAPGIARDRAGRGLSDLTTASWLDVAAHGRRARGSSKLCRRACGTLRLCHDHTGLVAWRTGRPASAA